MLNSVYHHPHRPPPRIPSAVLEELFRDYTTGDPCRWPDGRTLEASGRHCDTAPLGPFSYPICKMLKIELSKDDSIRPHTYCRHADDIYVIPRNGNHLRDLKNVMDLPSGFLLSSVLIDHFWILILRLPQGHKSWQCLGVESKCLEYYKINIACVYLISACITARL